MHRRPQVQHVALSAAVGVEALEDVLAEVRREGRLGVAELCLPVLQQAGQTFDFGSMRIVRDKVLGLGRIGSEVEQLRLVDLRVDDQFPAIVADGAIYEDDEFSRARGRTMYAFDFEGRHIWGFTAGVLKSFVDAWNAPERDFRIR